MTSPWAVPAPVVQFSLKDCDGDTVIWVHGGVHQNVPTRDYGQKPAARGTVIVLTGRFAGHVEEEQMIWSPKPLGQVAPLQPGAAMLSRIRVNKSATFDPPGAYEEQLGAQWMQAHPGELDRLRQKAVAQWHDGERRLMTSMPMQHAPVAQQGPPPGWATAPMPAPAPAQPVYAPLGNGYPPPVPPAPQQPTHGSPWPAAPPLVALVDQAAPVQPSTVTAPTPAPAATPAAYGPPWAPQPVGVPSTPPAPVAPASVAYSGPAGPPPAIGPDGFPVADISPTDALAAYGHPNGAGAMVPQVPPAPPAQTGF